MSAVNERTYPTDSMLAGIAVRPGDAGYDEVRQAWNLVIDQRPALVVMAETAAHVAAAVRYAVDAGLPVALQGTGHGVRRPADGAVLINTARMTGVHIDATRGTAWIEAGVKWGAVLAQTQAVGLAPLLGSSPTVGAVGYTLGGGMGWLARRYGLAADSVLRFQVVTADGRMLDVSRDKHPDLFWALRGGGGSLALVTGMEIQLYPVTTVYGGNLIYPAALAGDVLRRFRTWVQDAPDALTSSVALMNYPPIPELPEFLRGQSVVMVRGCYAGAVDEGEALLQPWLAWQAPMANLFHPMSFAEVATISNDPPGPLPGFASGAWLRTLSDDAIDALVRFGVNRDGSSPLIMTEVRHAGGAMRTVTEDASPIGHRDAEFVLSLVAMTPTPASQAAAAQYVRDLKRALAPVRAGVYMNFLDAEETQEQTADAYAAAAFDRLARVKAQYDPADRLCHGFNIPTARA